MDLKVHPYILLPLAALFLFLAVASLEADIVHLANGRTLEGEVTYQGDRVVVTTEFGSITLGRDEVLRVEHVSTAEEEYEQRASALAPEDTEGHYQLALWCRDQDLKGQAAAEARAVLAAVPDHEGAHRLLGHVFFDGRWMTEAQRDAEAARIAYPRLQAVLAECRSALADSTAPTLAGRVREVDALVAGLTPKMAANVGGFVESLPSGSLLAEEADSVLSGLQDVLALARRVSVSELQDASHLVRARRLVADYFLATSGPDEAKAITALAALDDVSAEVVVALAEEGSFYQAQPAGDRGLTASVGRDQVDYVVAAPPGYDPKRAYPLLVGCHAKGGTGGHFAERWRPPCLEHGYILACPTDPYGKGGYGARPEQRALVLATIEDVARQYHVDPDRVFLTGISAGGHATWDVGLHHCDRFAGIIPEAGMPVHEGIPMTRYLYLQNATAGLAVYSLVGEFDHTIRKTCEEATGKMKAMKVDASLVVAPGVGHDAYLSENDRVFAWMEGRRRNPVPTSIFKRLHHLEQGRAYWLEVTALVAPEWDSSKPVRLPGSYDADISKARLLELARAQVARDLPWVRASAGEGNLIKVTSSGVKRLAVWLSPTIIDFSRPVRIEVNRMMLWNREVEADARVALGEMKRSWDLGRGYLAAVELDLGTKTARQFKAVELWGRKGQ